MAVVRAYSGIQLYITCTSNCGSNVENCGGKSTLSIDGDLHNLCE